MIEPNIHCQYHNGMCAYVYRETDPYRCPWCHCTWRNIIVSGFHSCYVGDMWRGDDAHYRRSVASALETEARHNLKCHGCARVESETLARVNSAEYPLTCDPLASGALTGERLDCARAS